MLLISKFQYYKIIEILIQIIYLLLSLYINLIVTMLRGRECPAPPPPTPVPHDVSVYYGWFSEAQQQLRISYPTVHFNSRSGRVVQSPPYTYYMQGDRRVLVTEITHSSLPTARQQKNGDVCVGRVDGYWGRGEGGYIPQINQRISP